MAPDDDSTAGDPPAPATPAPRRDGGPSIAKRHRGAGQRVSRERGRWTRSKKNPGKRPHKGGS